MKVLIASNIAATFDFELDADMTVLETKAVIGAMLLDDASLESGTKTLRMNFMGKPLADDDTWGAIGVKTGDKVYAVVANPPPRASQPTAQIPHRASEKEEARAAQQQMQSLGPMIDMMASNPMFFEMMKAQSPELREMLKQHPELERDLRNPETLKYLLRAQLDPDARREMNLSIQSQMAQINAIPGGAAMIERAAGSLLRDADTYAPRTAADLKEATEANAMPREDQTANNSALPNPWARRPQVQTQFPAAQQHPFPALFGAPPAPPPPNSPSVEQIMQMLLGSASGAPASVQQPVAQAARREGEAPSQVPTSLPMTNQEVRVRYASQLAMLKDMGFEDEALNIDALRATNGDVDAAVCYIADRMEADEA